MGLSFPGQTRKLRRGLNGSRKTYFNLWRGFSYSLALLDHLIELSICFWNTPDLMSAGVMNYCRDGYSGYFAHLVQRPYEKPLVALVFRGGKGVGKMRCIERIGALLGRHSLPTSNRRYLVGNFNGHLENCLMFALDEAFWSGDKQAGGHAQGSHHREDHVIEHKGKSCTPSRIKPASLSGTKIDRPVSHDERRFAFFDVGDGRKQDRASSRPCAKRWNRGYPVRCATS